MGFFIGLKDFRHKDLKAFVYCLDVKGCTVFSWKLWWHFQLQKCRQFQKKNKTAHIKLKLFIVSVMSLQANVKWYVTKTCLESKTINLVNNNIGNV